MTSPYVLNEYNQPIGLPLPQWTAAQKPDQTMIQGQYCRLERLDPTIHTQDLFLANGQNEDERSWTYLPYGPFVSYGEFYQWISEMAHMDDPYFYSIIDLKTHKAVGVASLIRIFPETGSIEVGHLNFSPLMQKKVTATEALYLLAKYSFELGYRRYEWKCDSLNLPSKAAAKRLGFKYEGTFRQATVYKGRSRDTDWFSILDSEWPELQKGYEKWLAPGNFDHTSAQIKSLGEYLNSQT